jgi:hypothetical protein
VTSRLVASKLYDLVGTVILETIFLLISIQPESAIAAQRPCKSLVAEYALELKSLRTCLEQSSLATDCQPKLSSLQSRVKAIHQCLPAVPAGQGTGGGYKVSVELTYPGDCKAEAEEWKQTKFYDCLAKWNFSARQQFKLDLPEENCTTQMATYFIAKNLFDACSAKKQPEKPNVLRVKFY